MKVNEKESECLACTKQRALQTLLYLIESHDQLSHYLIGYKDQLQHATWGETEYICNSSRERPDVDRWHIKVYFEHQYYGFRFVLPLEWDDGDWSTVRILPGALFFDEESFDPEQLYKVCFNRYTVETCTKEPKFIDYEFDS